MEKISSSYPTRKTQFSKTVLPPHNQGMKTWYSLHISTTKAQKWTHNTFMRWNILASIRTYFSSRFFPLSPPIISRNIMIMTVVFCELSVPNLKKHYFSNDANAASGQTFPNKLELARKSITFSACLSIHWRQSPKFLGIPTHENWFRPLFFWGCENILSVVWEIVSFLWSERRVQGYIFLARIIF